MNRIKKTPLDLLNDIYSLAYWMTGSEDESRDLVNLTYRSANKETKESDLLRTFRKCYVERFGQYADFCIPDAPCTQQHHLLDSLKQWSADIKLSVLLSEISGLQHRQISEIVGKPVETIRLWLLCGRKLLVNDTMMKVSA
ncbi:RNA polymerase subunit sigma-24 [Chlorobium sp. BLA1]|uniref:RNA polymerase subunit sigma-24 n=1 Tax=Candidatus Chlorobium masyuteum TaxID=2716876 RepID=UPI00141F9A64|nr:RNA polymerase subunit sigma-24 [Candidatus Chlorobium masyuteum]NHQ60985.1 RNA polymerase subunit sigma-24 [Candidatus Chlorobium masyuteum]